MSRILLNTVVIISFIAYVDGFCKFPEYFHVCGKLKEPTCSNPVVNVTIKLEECLLNGPGCRCVNGYVRNLQTKTCMWREKCFGVTLMTAMHKTVDSLFTLILNHQKCK